MTDRTSKLVAELRKALTEPVIRGSHHVLMREAADVLERIQSAAETAAPRGKPCTCDNCLGSSVSCRVEAGERLGELWYCRKAAESAPKTPAERREYHANGTYWSGVPTMAMPCDFCQQGIEAHDPRTHACPQVKTSCSGDKP